MLESALRKPLRGHILPIVGVLSLLFTVVTAVPMQAQDETRGGDRQPISLLVQDDRVDVYIAAGDSADARVDHSKTGQLLTSVRLVGEGDEGHVPYLYPVNGPHQVPLTRNWPMRESTNEEQDHPHHRSLWFAHGAVGGLDFWTGRDGSRIEHQRIVDQTDGTSARLETINHWLSPDRELVAVDTRSWTFGAGTLDDGTAWRTIDLDLELESRRGDLLLGDTKEGTFAMRLRPELRLSGEVATGHCLNSESVRDGECWGKRARWVSYQGQVDERMVGVAIFDHPENLRHPSWWHARSYGLFAANPFGVHDFEGKPEGTGDFTLKAGAKLRLRYRVLLHDGSLGSEELEKLYHEW